MIYFKVILTFSQHITYLWLRFWDRRWHRFRVPGALLHVGVGDFRDGPAAVNVLEGPFQVQDVDLVFEDDRPMPSSLTRFGPKRPAAEIRGGGIFRIHGLIGPIWLTMAVLAL